MKLDDNQVATVGDVKEAVGVAVKEMKELMVQMAEVILNGVGELLKEYASKEDIKRIEERLVKVESDVTHIKRDISDLKADLPAKIEFANHEKRIQKLEHTLNINPVA